MNFGQAISSGFSNYANFAARAARSEYWYWALFVLICALVTKYVDGIIFSGMNVSPLYSLFSVATFVPGLAMAIRRLHDLDRSGWWFLIVFTIIGAFVLLYWFCQKGTSGPNRFGADPLVSVGQTPQTVW